jgi:hypothetical protein
MDFGQIFRRAWEITWRYKILWIFGLILALGGGAGSAMSGRGGAGMRWNMPAPMNMDMRWVVVMLALLLLGILASLAFAALSLIARGALIDGARQAEELAEVSGKAALKKGVSRFWSLLGIYLLAFLVIVALILPILLMIGAGLALGASGGQRTAPLVAPFICGVALLIIPLALAGILLALILFYAERACVLDGLGSVEALKKGWQMFRGHIGETLIIGVILMLINAVIAALFMGGAAGILLPVFALWRSARNAWIIALPLCGVGSLFVLLSLFVSALAETLNSVVWTLVYRRLGEGQHGE